MDTKKIRGRALRAIAPRRLSTTSDASINLADGNSENPDKGGPGGDTPIATQITYSSAYSTLTPNETLAGLTVAVSDENVPSQGPKHVLVLRVRCNGENVLGVSPSEGENVSLTQSTYLVPVPLSSSDAYVVDLQWAREGAMPQSIQWLSGTYSTYPVVSAIAEVDAVDVSDSMLTASVQYTGAPAGVGVKVTVLSKSGDTYTEVANTTTNDSVALIPLSSPLTSDALVLTAQCAVPLNTQGFTGGFNGPFSYGSQHPFESIPMAAETVTGLDYDGEVLSVAWSNFSNADGVVSDAGEMGVWCDGNMIASGEIGATEGQLSIALQEGKDYSITLQPEASNYSNLPLSAAVISSVPDVSNVTIVDSKVQAQVADNTNGYEALGYLMSASGILAGPVKATGGVLSFDYNAAGQVGIFVTAKHQSSDAITTGPLSAPAILLATAPTLVAGEIELTTADTQNWSLNFSWDRLPDAADDVIAYHATLVEDGKVIQEVHTTDLFAEMSIPVANIDTAKGHTIVLHATGITGGESPVNQWPVLFAGSEIKQLEITEDQLVAGWNAPAGVTPEEEASLAYEIAVYDTNNTILYTSDSLEGGQGSIALSHIPSDSIPLVTINAILGPNRLAVSTAATGASFAQGLPFGPEINPVSTDPLTNKATIHWNAVDNASSYSIIFSDGSSVDDVADTSYELTDATPVSGDIFFSICAHGTSNGAETMSPFSEEVAIPALTTNVVSVHYDATTAEIFWEGNDNALSYDVSVFKDGEQPEMVFSAITEETMLMAPITSDGTSTYTIHVQAVLASGTGRSGTTQPLFSAGYYLSKQAFPIPPYVYIASSQSMLGDASTPPSNQTISLFFPELSTEANGLGTVEIEEGPFKMTPISQGEYVYQLDIANTDEVWKFDENEPVRTQLQMDYVNFLKKLEAPPSDETLPGASPLGIQLVQKAIARCMPQTFAELMFYSAGFSTLTTVGSGFVDLRPGMVMRVTISDYINIPQYDVPQWINGYAGATVLDFPIGGYSAESDWRVGFDAFLSMLSERGALEVNPPLSNSDSTQAGMADGADLYYSKFIEPFYRLYFPGQISSPTGTGSNSTTQNFTLVAASSYTDLQTTTVNPTNTSTAYFRGRSTVELLQQVEINGNTQLVPVGSTVGNILDQLGQRPYSTSNALQKIRVTRTLDGAVTNTNNALALDSQLEIHFDWDGYTRYSLVNGLDIFSLPLLPGDVIITH